MPLAAHRLGAGEPRLVLAHGFTQTARSWSYVATELAHDHEVVAVDLPGHGDSAEVRADLPEGASLLGAAGGRAVYVGYSMGGRHVLRLACDRPDLVRGMVLVGATAGIDDPAERAARRAADDALADDIETVGVDTFLTRWMAQPMFARLPSNPEERADRRRNTAAGLAASLRLAGTGAQDPIWDRLGSCTVPALVLAGALDTKFVALGHRLTELLGGPAELAAVDGAGHAVHLERPDAFLGAVRAWLAGLGR